MKILLAKPRGFCAGVDRAIQIVEKTLDLYGSPVFIRHEIVHNKAVVDRLKDMGAVFVKEIDSVPEGANVIFSAHGVGEQIYRNAASKNLNIVDAACPLVKKVHFSAKRHDKKGLKIVLIGHEGHPEVVGTMGQIEGDMYLVSTPEDVTTLSLTQEDDIAYITQTTLSMDETRGVITALREKYPDIRGPEQGDMCYATTNRQAAVKQLAEEVDLLLVVGSSNSSNSARLAELGSSLGVQSYLIDSKDKIDKSWLTNVKTVGISSGASAPEHLVQEVVEFLKFSHPGSVSEDFVVMEENVKFTLPKQLQSVI
jgi:4-hydroxy-3-methylbut-2-enyl diphosphate reductase